MLSTGISYTLVSSPSHSASQPTIINTQVPTVVALLSTGISYTAPSLQYSASQPNTQVPTVVATLSTAPSLQYSASQPNTQVPTVVATLSTGISYTLVSSPSEYSASQPTIINTEVPTGSTASILSVSLAITGGI